MPLSSLIILIVVFFLTSFIGVVTGSNSLISVPAMFQVGIDPKVAVATNMFGLTFSSIGASIPFVRWGVVDFRKILPLIILTIISSALGAMLVGLITGSAIKLIVSIAMIFIAVFTLVRRNAGVTPGEVSTATLVVTYVLSFLLGVYGGLYSGGYVTVLTTVLVAFFGMTFSESIASTKVINVFSSLVASALFMWQGLVDYKLGVILGATMFVASYLGAHYATKMNDVWLKRIFLATVFLLAIKTLYDFT
jgi:uncharacterized membrane protein YfcA